MTVRPESGPLPTVQKYREEFWKRIDAAHDAGASDEEISAMFEEERQNLPSIKEFERGL